MMKSDAQMAISAPKIINLSGQRIHKFAEMGDDLLFAGNFSVQKIRDGGKDKNRRCNDP